MKTIAEIGVDIVDICRFKKINSEDLFYKKIFTAAERAYCLSKKDASMHFAARFAAKEAVKKAIKENIEFIDIEIIRKKDGAPKVTINNPKIRKKYNIKLSMSHDGDVAIAFCIAAGKGE